MPALPDGLEADVQAVWSDFAPLASEAGTLVPGTVPAFVRMCRAIVRHAKWDAQIVKDGETYLKISVDGAGVEHSEVKAHPLIGKSQTLENQIRSWLKDFALNPFGKAIDVPVEDVDPFEEYTH